MLSSQHHRSCSHNYSRRSFLSESIVLGLARSCFQRKSTICASLPVVTSAVTVSAAGDTPNSSLSPPAVSLPSLTERGGNKLSFLVVGALMCLACVRLNQHLLAPLPPLHPLVSVPLSSCGGLDWVQLLCPALLLPFGASGQTRPITHSFSWAPAYFPCSTSAYGTASGLRSMTLSPTPCQVQLGCNSPFHLRSFLCVQGSSAAYNVDVRVIFH